VQPMALAAAAAGADGIIVEVHPEPDTALSDGPQSLTLEGFEQMMRTLAGVLAAVNRPLARVSRPVLQATA
jgi:3-deoxy-7-phosphoheptulonate synthase